MPRLILAILSAAAVAALAVSALLGPLREVSEAIAVPPANEQPNTGYIADPRR